MLSVFTPTHSPKHLPETYRSLARQAGCEWEWIVLTNGNCPALPAEITADPRVRVVPANPADGNRIGALKRAACDAARGDAFVELDHDDLLLPGTLAKVQRAIDDGADFAYSDAAVFKHGTLEPHAWTAKAGWESYPITVYGRELIASRCFDITPRSLCEIYFSPDHVRCWSRQAYYKAGGHNRVLAVGDDQDLMCATYLTGGDFVHIGGCGYLYRSHPDNTVKKANDAIQKQVAANRKKYLRPLILEWCRRESADTLSLRDLIKSGWRIDRDLKNGLAPENSLGLIDFTDCLQYLPPGYVLPLMNAAFDALMPGGWLYVAVPTTQGGMAAYQHPGIRSYYNVNSFWYYTEEKYAKQCPGVRCRFQMVDPRNFYYDQEQKRMGELYFEAYFCALKGQRQPGIQAI